ncbi:MAG: periplasmic [NiFeSe] hydrogenase large subunit [Deferrisomatales bacterium]
MATIQIMDPVTRIEGHMKVEVTIDAVGGQQQVVDARCSGTLFRGFETVLQGRAPSDAPVLTQRICGVCPVSHGTASVLALESAAHHLPPTNARLLRNLVLGSNFVMSHILHFYVLAALDYAQGPQTAPWTPAWEVDLRPGLDGVVAHLGQALEARRRAHEMGAVFAGKMPSPHSFMPGGFTGVPTAEKVAQFRSHLDWLRHFIDTVYLPDVLAVANLYSDYFTVGAGCQNLLAYGVFEQDDAGQQKLLAPGYVEGPGSPVGAVSDWDITEAVTYSWYADATGGLPPHEGATQPTYPKGDAYSWLKAPRYQSRPFEVGPLARMWVNGDYSRGISVMDRHAARAYETAKVAAAMVDWLDQLDLAAPVYDGNYDPDVGEGVGLTEAPRGALGHWVRLSGGKIDHYQVITPTCWNASPRDDRGVPGPMEQALIGTPILDPERPIEALRVIHSFDPCLSCAVHVMRPDRPPVVVRAGGV